MLVHAVRTLSRKPFKHALLGVAATTALLAGVPVPAAAAPTAPTASAAADLPEGTQFKIQNYQTKGCATAEPGFENVWAVTGPARDPFCSTEHAIWVQGSGNSIRSRIKEKFGVPLHWCLGANESGRVSVTPCDGGNNQKWTRYSEGFVKNWATKQCLDVESESPEIVYTRECLKHDWQKWAFKPI